MTTDTPIFFTLITFFFVIGIIAPIINVVMDESVVVNNAEVESPSGLTTALASILNILLIPFWTLGFPTWINIVFIPFRILTIYLGYRAIRGI